MARTNVKATTMNFAMPAFCRNERQQQWRKPVCKRYDAGDHSGGGAIL